MSTVLVTGGAGFLGSHLCDRLIERGDDVICLDNFFTGNKKNIEHLLSNNRFELVRHDIVHPFYLEVDRIFNLACPASPEAYQYNPIKTIKTSTVGMVNVMGLAKRCGARILHASTSEVYGDPLVHPQTEEYWGHVNPIGPRSCYDEGKRIAESLMMNYHQAHGLEIRIIRIFNTYGPRMDPNMVASSKLHHSGHSRRRHYGLRRRYSNSLVLLLQRPDRRHASPNGSG